MNNGLLIHHFIVMPDSENESLFQGFKQELIDKKYIIVLNSVMLYPKHIFEIFLSQQELIIFRNEIPAASITPVNLASLKQILPHLKNQPLITITHINEDLSFINELNFKVRPITIGLTKNDLITLKPNSNIFILDKELERRADDLFDIDYLNKTLAEIGIDNKKKLKLRINNWYKGKFISACHLITSPNEKVLLNLGFKFSENRFINGSHDINKCINLIIDSCSTTIEKAKIKNKECIVYSPGMYAELYNFNSLIWNRLKREIKEKEYRDFIFNAIFRNPNYSGYQIKDKKEIMWIENNDLIKNIFSSRRGELILTALSIDFLTINKNCVAIRLPNSINFQRGIINELDKLSKINTDKAKCNFDKKAKQLNNVLKEIIGDDFIDYIKNGFDSLTLCTDIPVEWVTFNKIPLMFTHEVSKINVTPGNMLMLQSIDHNKLVLKKEGLKKIKIIRSFKEDDQIKFFLENALKNFENIYDIFDFNIIDVQSESELIDAINNDITPILIFDCHGNHGGNESNGWLEIGSDQVDVWQLPCKHNISPIILLSACSTSAISGSHASVANGFISLGAITVLGTALPVNAIESAIFISRIIFRLSNYLDVICKMNLGIISWKTLISTFLKMSFSTDVLRYFKEKNMLEEDDFIRIHIESNTLINTYNENWFEYICQKVSDINNFSLNDVYDLVSEKYFFETMNYIQIGRPENILIDLE